MTTKTAEKKEISEEQTKRIIELFNNNIGNKLTIELANGMYTLLNSIIKEG